mmetsp:Transcript_113615/g.197416  ORF Transcript_113615/g.197416 Transcript_113615/m.197416 type:complete len:125 (-) Transcript_113615:869-1243(-)
MGAISSGADEFMQWITQPCTISTIRAKQCVLHLLLQAKKYLTQSEPSLIQQLLLALSQSLLNKQASVYDYLGRTFIAASRVLTDYGFYIRGVGCGRQGGMLRDPNGLGTKIGPKVECKGLRTQS